MNQEQEIILEIINKLRTYEGLSLASIAKELKDLKDDQIDVKKDLENVLLQIVDKVDSIPLNEEIGKVNDKLRSEVIKLESKLSKSDDTISSIEKKALSKIQTLIADLREELESKVNDKSFLDEIKTKIEENSFDKFLKGIKEVKLGTEDIKGLEDFVKSQIPITKDFTPEIVDLRNTVASIGTKNYVPAGVEIFHNGQNFGRIPSINFIGGTLNASASRVDVSLGSSGGAGASSFLDLTDTPSSYTGEALKVVRVNAGETGLEFTTLTGGGDALTSDPLSQFASTTSAQLRAVLTDETGTGSAVFANTPTLVTPNIGAATGTSLLATGDIRGERLGMEDTDSSHYLFLDPGSNLTADRVLTITTGDANRTLTLSGDADISGTNTGDQSLSIAAGSAGAIQVTDGSGNFIGSHTDFLFYDTSNNLLYLLDETTTYFKTGDYTTGFNFNADGISSSTIRTYTAPDADGTLVLADFAQNLDNKVIDASTNTITNIGASEIEAGIITGLTAETTVANDDVIMIYDTSASALRKMTRANFVSGLGGGGANTALSNLASVAINTTLVSDTDNTDALGTSAIAWSDLFLGNGAVITWSTSPSTPDVTLTHSANALTLDGGDLVLARIEGTVASGLTLSSTGNPLSLLTDTDVIIDTEGTGNYARLRTQNLTGSQNLEFPDASGTFALTNGNTFTGVHDFGGATSLEIPNDAGGTTVDASGEICIDTTSRTLNFYDGTLEAVLNPIQSKTITIPDPSASEDITLPYFDDAITITKIVFVITGSTSVTATVRHGTDRSATGTEVVTGGTVVNSTTTGNVVTSFDDATVPADSFLWLETTALSGTPTSLSITIFYRQDA